MQNQWMMIKLRYQDTLVFDIHSKGSFKRSVMLNDIGQYTKHEN